MVMSINRHRRRFIKYSALGAAASVFPELLLAKSGQLKSYPSANFNPDVEIEFTARKAYVPVMPSGPNTNVQKYYAKLVKGPENTLQQLKGNYLGPVLNLEKGQKVRIYFNNDLSEPSIIHWHGLHVPQKSDGHPMYAIQPGERYVYEFEVMNRAGTSFYHSHTHEMTATQVYRGLAGYITVTDEYEKALELPVGEYDLPLVIQDRSFNDKNQLQYIRGMHGRMLGFLGDKILVNGKPDIVFNVKSRAYRCRAVNGSNSRIYKLGWDDGTPLTAIATDAGLLEKPETRPYIMLAPGERVDLWLDFSGRKVGSKLVMYSLPYSGAMPPMVERMMNGESGGGKQGGRGMMGGMMGMKGGGMRGGMMGRMKGNMGGGMMRGGMGMMSGSLAQGAKFPIVTFHVTEKVSDSPDLPAKLVNIQRFTENDVDNANNPVPIGITMKPMSPQLNGKSFSMDRVMDYEKIPLNSIKKIKIFHDHGPKKSAHQDESGKGGMQMGAGGMQGGGMGMMMSMAHPIHLHGQQFQIISRKMEGMRKQEYDTVKEGYIDSGWKDTVLVMPGEEIEVIKPFQDFKGLFLYHCHNLEHEDLGMMRNFYVG
jgi:FtsP/CotA-like multicopper oxidase with cupredoxin domain